MIFSRLFGRTHASAPSHVVSFDDLRKELDVGEVELIDVREQSEFRNGHVPGSKNMPLSRFNPATLPRDRKVVLICLSGARSGSALRHLQHAGFENVRHFSGGVAMWRTLGGPLTTR